MEFGFNQWFLRRRFLKGVDDRQKAKVGKVLTARENPGGKRRVFPGWAILQEIAVLGNKIFSPSFHYAILLNCMYCCVVV